MAGEKLKTARTIATITLNQFNAKHNYAGPALNKLLPQTSQKQRATDLVFGTIRNRIAIDMVIAKFADCPIGRIPAKLLNIIRIGAYELLYSPATAEYAIVNEAVENAGTITGPVRSKSPGATAANRKTRRTSNGAGKKQTGFVNAVLRQITRHIQNRQIPLSEANAQRTLPQTPSAGCEFDSNIFPEPTASPADYFSIAFSLPKWLVVDWLTEFGTEKTRQICFASNRKPSVYIRPNRLKTTTEELAEKFRQVDIDFDIVPNVIPAPAFAGVNLSPQKRGAGIQKSSNADDSIIRLKSPKAIAELPGFAEGLFSVQDITASQAAIALKPQPDWTILDLCAAPGGKTTQLAELTGDKAQIFATDIDAERLKKVKENTARLGIKSVSVIAYEELEKHGLFDCVLLDVPCSNTGVLAKRPEVRLRIKPKAIKDLAKIQSELLQTAAIMIKPEGKICYSTCSIQKSENNELVKEFLQKHRNLKLESELLTLPSVRGFGCDGGYIALITRI